MLYLTKVEHLADVNTHLRSPAPKLGLAIALPQILRVIPLFKGKSEDAALVYRYDSEEAHTTHCLCFADCSCNFFLLAFMLDSTKLLVSLDSGTNALTQAHSVVEITQLYQRAIETEVEWVYFVNKSVDVDAEASDAQFVR